MQEKKNRYIYLKTFLMLEFQVTPKFAVQSRFRKIEGVIKIKI